MSCVRIRCASRELSIISEISHVMFSPTPPLQPGGNEHEELTHSDHSGFSSGSGYLGTVQHIVHAKSPGTTLAAHRLALRQRRQPAANAGPVYDGGQPFTQGRVRRLTQSQPKRNRNGAYVER